MKYRVVFRDAARDEAVEAAAYIAEQGYPETAIEWYQALEAASASLSEQPLRCSYARENDAIPGVELRQLVFKSHRIIFTIRNDEVHVLHVRHTRQRLLVEEQGKDEPGSEEPNQ